MEIWSVPVMIDEGKLFKRPPSGYSLVLLIYTCAIRARRPLSKEELLQKQHSQITVYKFPQTQIA